LDEQNDSKTTGDGRDFSPQRINRAVFSEALQHPATLYPAAASLIGAAYLALIQANPTLLVVAVGGGFISVASFIFNYFIRGDKLAASYIEKVRRDHIRRKATAADDIARRCRESGFTEGEKETGELKQSYDRLAVFLKQKMGKERALTAARFLSLADECYAQSLSLIDRALVMHRALREIDAAKLDLERLECLGQLEILKNRQDPHGLALAETVQARISSHEKRLVLYWERKKSMEQLLAECEVLEASLDTAYLEAVDLIQTDPGLHRASLAENLERAVQAARRVEERLQQGAGILQEKPIQDITNRKKPT